jgi:hypothetical protein
MLRERYGTAESEAEKEQIFAQVMRFAPWVSLEECPLENKIL